MHFIVQPAREEDARRIAVLSTQLGYPVHLEEVRRRLDRILPHDGNAVFVARLPEGQVVGWIQVRIRHLLVAGQQAEIEGIVVDESFRRRGVGRLLMNHAEQWALEQGCPAVFLRSNIEREGARQFYGALGYENFKVQRAYRKAL